MSTSFRTPRGPQVCSAPSRRRMAPARFVIVLALLGAPPCGAAADPWEKIAEGRVAASRDDHAVAIEAFRAAIAEDPGVRDTISVALASQLTWAGRYDEAIAEFERFLRAHPRRADAMATLALAQSWNDRPGAALETYRRILALDPSNRDAAFGEARMLSWQGRLDAAMRAYDALLFREPEWFDAAVGRAQVVNWRGDHRRAAALFGDALRVEPGEPAALTGRAAAWNWAGRADRALLDLEDALRTEPGNQDARSLERGIRNAWSPACGLAIDFSRDSDSFRYVATRLESEVPFAWRGRVRASLLRGAYTKPGRQDAFDLWAGLAGDMRLSDPWLVYAGVQVLARPPRGVSGPRGTGDIHAAWLPGDRFRIDAGYARLSLFTYERSPDGSARYLDADLFDVGLSARPYWRTTVSLSADRGLYDDGNRRVNLRLRARQSLLSKPRLWIDGGGQWLDFDRPGTAGIWSPDRYRSLLLAPECEWNPLRDVALFGRIDTGVARERAGATTAYLAAGGGARYDRGRVRIEARGGRSASNLETARGYRRTYASAAIRIGF